MLVSMLAPRFLHETFETLVIALDAILLALTKEMTRYDAESAAFAALSVITWTRFTSWPPALHPSR
jgi:hypothetical protein